MKNPSERVCDSCGYDLRGLPLGRPCPECGATQRSTFPGGVEISGAKDIALSQMPEQLVKRIAFCCAALFLAVMVVLARFFIAIQGMGIAIDVVVAILWVMSVYLMTNPMTDPEAVWRGLGNKGRVRLIARWATFGAAS